MSDAPEKIWLNYKEGVVDNGMQWLGEAFNIPDDGLSVGYIRYDVYEKMWIKYEKYKTERDHYRDILIEAGITVVRDDSGYRWFITPYE